MTIYERAADSRARARSAGISVPATDDPYRRRLRAALTRDIATLLAIPAGHVVVSDDPIRAYSAIPGPLITVYDPDDADTILWFIPETGYTGTGGGAYLLLGACSGCAGDVRARGNVPVMTISGLADLDQDEHLRCQTDLPPAVPVEFYDDPAHAPDCPLRSPHPAHNTQE